jgi:ATPase subunit of ABC transporter with duplicated ATPase domains
MGHERLFAIMQEKDAIYANPEFSEEDGHKAAELETEFAGLGGWEAETDAATLLNGLGIGDDLLHLRMKELKDF